MIFRNSNSICFLIYKFKLFVKFPHNFCRAIHLSRGRSENCTSDGKRNSTKLVWLGSSVLTSYLEDCRFNSRYRSSWPRFFFQGFPSASSGKCQDGSLTIRLVVNEPNIHHWFVKFCSGGDTTLQNESYEYWPTVCSDELLRNTMEVDPWKKCLCICRRVRHAPYH
jgi:hypothetical protein